MSVGVVGSHRMSIALHDFGTEFNVAGRNPVTFGVIRL